MRTSSRYSGATPRRYSARRSSAGSARASDLSRSLLPPYTNEFRRSNPSTPVASAAANRSCGQEEPSLSGLSRSGRRPGLAACRRSPRYSWSVRALWSSHKHGDDAERWRGNRRTVMPLAAIERHRGWLLHNGAQRRAFGCLKLKRRWRWVASGIAGRSFITTGRDQAVAQSMCSIKRPDPASLPIYFRSSIEWTIL
jgi:hypothetical protein